MRPNAHVARGSGVSDIEYHAERLPAFAPDEIVGGDKSCCSSRAWCEVLSDPVSHTGDYHEPLLNIHRPHRQSHAAGVRSPILCVDLSGASD